MYLPSKHNIIRQIAESDEWFLVNPLSGQADILTGELARQFIGGNVSDPEPFVEKGYLVEPEEEEHRFRAAYLDFLSAREREEIQVFFVPTYACNFACPYCYQGEYGHKPTYADSKVVDAFFSHLDTEFAGKAYYITVFGGEPLLPGDGPRRTIEHLIREANARKIDLAFVTNGYTLSEYLPLLELARIREIQVTLDGVGALHDARRPHRSGRPSFGRIVAGIDEALALDIQLNLRVVVDRDNIGGLVELARFAIQKGWTQNERFKTQLGRNYELHSCQADEGRLFTRIEMYREIYRLVDEHPELLEFHRPAFSISRFLFDHGTMPDPLFDSCPACKTEWAFDYTGSIYSCTATVGKRDEALGTFYPSRKLDVDRIEEWQDRDVCAIEKCRVCALQLACGGGCGSVAKNENGSICSPDCRPVDELIGLGISLYSRETPVAQAGT